MTLEGPDERQLRSKQNNIMSTLYKIPGEVEFEGMIVHDEMITPKEIENVRQNLHVIDGDVIIAAYPRSGKDCCSLPSILCSCIICQLLKINIFSK